MERGTSERLTRAAVALAAFSRERIRAAKRRIAKTANLLANWLHQVVQQVARLTTWLGLKARRILEWTWQTYTATEDHLLRSIAAVVAFVYAVRQLFGFAAVAFLATVATWLLFSWLIGPTTGAIAGGLVALGMLALIVPKPALADQDNDPNRESESLLQVTSWLIPKIRFLLRVAILLTGPLLWYGPQYLPATVADLITQRTRKPEISPEKPAVAKPTGIATKTAQDPTHNPRPLVPNTKTTKQTSSLPVAKPRTKENQIEDARNFTARIRQKFDSGSCNEALLECNRGLKLHPNNQDLLTLKKRILASIEQGFC